MNVCVIIPAAGRGTRFGPSDKLSQEVGGRPLLMRTVELFTKRDEVRSIIVAGPPEALEDFKNRYGAPLGFHVAAIVQGGRLGRWETVRNALEAVPEGSTRIAVHDAARPAVCKQLLDRVVEAARTLPAVIPAVPIAATLKRAADETIDVADHQGDALADAILGEAGRQSIAARRVIETVDRSGLVEVQTPQIFDADLLRRAYAQDDLSHSTDDASLIEQLGEPVYVVQGDVRNIKVTTPADLKLLRSILGVKPPSERPIHKRF